MNFLKSKLISAVTAVAMLFSSLGAVVPSVSVTPQLAVSAIAAATAVASVTQSTGAQAAAMTDYFENKVIDATFRAQAFPTLTTIYISLRTSACSDSAAGTEVSGGSYARVAVTSSLANWAGTQSSGSTTASSGTGGTTSNNGSITFPAPTANWGVITHVGFEDASTAGNQLFCVALTISKTVNNGDAAPSFAAAALTMQIDN